MVKRLITALAAWLILCTPLFAAEIDYTDFTPELIYAEHLEEVDFCTRTDIDSVIAEVIDVCEKNQEILGWWCEWEPTCSGTRWSVRYEWRPTVKLLNNFGELSKEDYMIQQKAEEILLSTIKTGMSDYQKIYEIYHWIQNNTDYDYEALETAKTRYDYSQNAREALFDGKAVCAGYSDAFYYLSNLAGVDCTFVHGNKHAWNAVQLYGKWYFVDVTDESGHGFLRGTSWAESHGYSWDKCYLGIEISEKDYDF